jgi:8-oxo-dGTP pyrophosphatase MutT (NUDIX family)|tara:strand:- start:2842 stop:3438 length:597 start_codon:yes stop_codon:yes gene_type:complete
MSQKVGTWSVVREEQLQDCRVFTVHRSVRQSPIDQSEHDFFLIHSQSWVNIVPVTSDHQIVFVRQFRHGSNSVSLEIPGGLVDPGEDPATAAARECLEETGYQVGTVQSLGTLNPNPALFPNTLYTHMATGAMQTAEIANTAREHTEVELVPIDRLTERLVSGEIDHALVVATLWRFLHVFRQSGGPQSVPNRNVEYQ